MARQGTLRISPALSLPANAVTSTMVVYGGKGMGKTNFGGVLVEELSASHLRWSVIDPMGVWWGMRYSADGKGKGVECLILGGAHGDIPIEPTGGAVVADLVADERANVIIDISRKADGEMWSIGERIRFVRDYGKQLFRRQGSLVDGKRREPICQVIDEAARFLPQMISSGEQDVAQCMGIWRAIVEEGRNVGIGVVLLTQRSARLNKDVAELADLMLAFRTVGPNSIRAVTDWLGEQVSKADLQRMVEQVRSLPIGSCLAVSPGWLQEEKVVPIRVRHTFDSSATPKPGESTVRVQGEGAKPDLEAYAQRMAATIERAKAESVPALTKRVRELEVELARKPAAALPAVAKVHKLDEEKLAMLTEKLDAVSKGLAEAQKHALVESKRRDQAVVLIDKLRDLLTPAMAADTLALVAVQASEATKLRAEISTIDTNPVEKATTTRAKTQSASVADTEVGNQLSGPARKVVDALGRFQAIGVMAPPRIQVCLFSGYGNLTSTGFVKALGALRSAGLISYGGDGTLSLTESGLVQVQDVEPIRNDEELQQAIFSIMGGPERKVLAELITNYPDRCSRQHLMSVAGYSNLTSTGFVKALGKLRSLGYADYSGPGQVLATKQCFLPASIEGH